MGESAQSKRFFLGGSFFGSTALWIELRFDVLTIAGLSDVVFNQLWVTGKPRALWFRWFTPTFPALPIIV